MQRKWLTALRGRAWRRPRADKELNASRHEFEVEKDRLGDRLKKEVRVLAAMRNGAAWALMDYTRYPGRVTREVEANAPLRPEALERC
jgi:hypothetical protein